MEKNRINFWVDAAIFILFIVLVFSGFLLHLHPFGGGGGSILTLTGQDWKGLHMLTAQVFLILVIAHLVLHRSWGGTCGKKYTGIGPRVLGAITGFLLLAAVCVPFFLVGDSTGGGGGYRGGRGEGYGIESDASGFNRGSGPAKIAGYENLETVEAPAETTPNGGGRGNRWGKNR